MRSLRMIGSLSSYAIAVGLLAAAACSHKRSDDGGAKVPQTADAEPKQDDAPTEPPADVPTPEAKAPTFTALNEALFKPLCVNCHAGPEAAAGVRFDDYEAMVTANDEGEFVVDPGSPETSLLMEVLEAPSLDSDPPRMPPYGDAVSQTLIDEARAWIKAGAPSE